MVSNFYECARSGGKIVNKKTKEGENIKICYDKKGNSFVKNNNKRKPKNKQKSFSSPSKESLQKLVEHFNN